MVPGQVTTLRKHLWVRSEVIGRLWVCCELLCLWGCGKLLMLSLESDADTGLLVDFFGGFWLRRWSVGLRKLLAR